VSDELVRPKFPLKELMEAGPNAARVLVRHTVETAGRDIQSRVEKDRSQDDFDVEKYVDRLIKSQLTLARSEGAGAGLIATGVELSSWISGPGAVAALGTTVLADVAVLASIQVRLSLMIAAAYGHSMDDVDTRVGEILSLHSLELTAAKVAGPAAAKAGRRVGKRLLEKYLRGALLQSLKSLFRLVGIKFTRTALVRGLPLINVPANATVADLTTRRTAAKARNYYRTLPSGS
jgi:hypothetical protein